MNRRTFLKSSAAAGMGSVYLLAGCASEADTPEPKPQADTLEATNQAQQLDRIGVQLYTLRSLLADDFEGSIEQVAGIGYDEVEFAGYYDRSPADIKALLDHAGLTAPSAHASIDLFRDDPDAVIEAAQIMGHRYLVIPWLAADDRESIDQYKRHAAFFNEVGQQCKAAGLQLAYHNHDFEFQPIDGQIPYDVLLDETDPDLVAMELDLFWIAQGGHDPMHYFERYPGRFPLSHVKDRTAEGEMVDVGAGTIDFAAILAKSDQAGMTHFIVEHDNPPDPMASIAASYTYLKDLRF